MTAAYELTFEALQDLRGIWTYIAVRHGLPAAADRLWRDLEVACRSVAQTPSLGHLRRDLTSDPEVLFYCVREHYLIIYRRGSEPLQIVRVLHGARDIARELEELD